VAVPTAVVVVASVAPEELVVEPAAVVSAPNGFWSIRNPVSDDRAMMITNT
jgi:hypothetical protein